MVNAENVLSGFVLYVPHYRPNKEKQVELSEHISSKVATEFYYIEGYVSMYEKNTRSLDFWIADW